MRAVDLVGLPGFAWRAGMRDTSGLRVVRMDGAVPIWATEDGRRLDGERLGGHLPDLDDGATGGCLLAMLTALGEVFIHGAIGGDEPCLVRAYPFAGGGPIYGQGPTLGRACALALVAIGRCA